MSEAPPRAAWARRLLGNGEEPDPRFTLANERTFLAWVRTSLALAAAGVALRLVDDSTVARVVAVALALAGAALAAGALPRWVGLERALRQRRPLPAPVLVPLLSVLVAAAAVVLVVYLALG